MTDKVKQDFPDTTAQMALEMRVFRIYSFLCLAAVVAFIASDVSFHPGIQWPLFTAAGVASMWVASVIGFVKRYNLMKNAMWQLILVSVGSVLWDIFTQWHAWSVDYVLPVVCMVILVSMAVISKVQKYMARDYMIYFAMACSYGVIVPLILLLTGVVTWSPLCNLCVVVCFLFLAALIIFKGKEFWEEMHKKFHV